MNKMEANELRVNGRTLSALRQGHNKNTKILCVHGWLDNANSFAPLAPYLPNADVVAIDLPGHGRSAHLTDSIQYSFTGQAQAIIDTASHLGWNRYHLIGHSLGGCLAPFCAVASSDSIASITMIDAAGPQTEQAEELPARLARASREFARLDRYNSRCYATMDDAVASRLRANKMSHESARLIVERQLTQTDDGYVWSFDRKLRVASARYFTEPQLLAVLKSVSCPTLVILAEDSFVISNPKTPTRLECLQNLSLRNLPGNHHLHMDTPEPVGNEIRQFLEDGGLT